LGKGRDFATDRQRIPSLRRARINLVLPAGEIPAPIRGGAASPGIESWAREVTNRTKRRQSDARAVTKVKLLSLVKYLTAGRQYRSGWQAPVGTPQMARWPETAAGSGSTARSEREAPRDLGDPLWSRSADEADRVCRTIWIIPEKGRGHSGSRIRWYYSECGKAAHRGKRRSR